MRPPSNKRPPFLAEIVPKKYAGLSLRIETGVALILTPVTSKIARTEHQGPIKCTHL